MIGPLVVDTHAQQAAHLPHFRAYLAGALRLAPYLCRLGRALTTLTGCEIVSGWHDEVVRLGLVVDPHDRVALRAIYDANARDLARSHAVVAITHEGNPRATLCEIGAAIALGKPIAWVQGQDGRGGNSYDASPLVRRIIAPAEHGHDASLVVELATVLAAIRSEQVERARSRWCVPAGDADCDGGEAA